MASPISNDSTLNIGAQKSSAAQAKAEERAKKEGDAAVSEGINRDDQLTLSEAGKQLSAERAANPINSADEAKDMVGAIRDMLNANPGFATAVHNAAGASRVATLLDNYA